MATKKIYFVRHGEAAGNVTGFTQVATTPLTETGHRQASIVAERFATIPLETVMASYMDRAQDTARYIAAKKKLEVETVEYFHEWIKPTSIHGLAHTSAEYQSYMAIEQQYYTNPTWRFEDGENYTDVLERISAGVAMLEARPEQHIVVVSHGRALRFLMSYLLHKKQLTAEIEQLTHTSMVMSNTGITLFEYDTKGWKLVTWNDTAHFAE